MEVPGIAKPRRNPSPERRLNLFTLERAHRTLPLVRRIVADVVRCHKRICALEERCQISTPEGADPALDELRRIYGKELDRLRALSDELSTIGCELKDVRRGIVDYRSLLRGRVIEFCWRLGEESIQHWHEIDDGFHDRRRIDAEVGAELSRV